MCNNYELFFTASGMFTSKGKETSVISITEYHIYKIHIYRLKLNGLTALHCRCLAEMQYKTWSTLCFFTSMQNHAHLLVTCKTKLGNLIQ